MCVEQSGVAISNRNETANEPCASVLMRIYNLDVAPDRALFELRKRVRLEADLIYKKRGTYRRAVDARPCEVSSVILDQLINISANISINDKRCRNCKNYTVIKTLGVKVFT